jgi:shikimate dehydrogenase
MLVAQAVIAAELFTGESVNRSEISRIYRELMSEKTSIVLTGMPCSGKTTLGRILSEKLGRPLVETDDEIIARAGMPITEIFSRYGEKHFRDLESEVIFEASLSGGKVISTGGGAVLRKENTDNLKTNGTIVFLDRRLEDLIPSDDRPLVGNTDKIRKLHEERCPIYKGAADVIIKVQGTEESTADEIWRALK